MQKCKYITDVPLFPSKIKLGDIDIASQQVERLFDVDIGVNNLVAPEHQPLISESDYAGKKKIVFVKPTPNNIDDFYDSHYFKNKCIKYRLDNERKKTEAERFPQNKTVAFSYPQEIIYGYYLKDKPELSRARSVLVAGVFTQPGHLVAVMAPPIVTKSMVSLGPLWQVFC